MAGAVRQPIDVPALERYLQKHVSAIRTPLDVKQVLYSISYLSPWTLHRSITDTLAPDAVRIWPVESNLPAHNGR
jgi:hypothetical protein